MDKLNIVVLAGGLGKRFSNAGYKTPKPLLEINGTPLYQAVLFNFLMHYKGRVGKVNIVTRKEYKIANFPIKIFDNIIYQDKPTGALDSAFLGLKDIPNDEMVIFMNCDQLISFNGHNLNTIINNMDNYDFGILFHFNSQETKWGYSGIDNGRVIAIKEKCPISNFAHTGHYLIKEVNQFIQMYQLVKLKNIKVNGEYFLSSIYSVFLDHNKYITCGHILPFHVDRMIPLGQPDDYEKNKNIKI